MGSGSAGGATSGAIALSGDKPSHLCAVFPCMHIFSVVFARQVSRALAATLQWRGSSDRCAPRGAALPPKRSACASGARVARPPPAHPVTTCTSHTSHYLTSQVLGPIQTHFFGAPGSAHSGPCMGGVNTSAADLPVFPQGHSALLGPGQPDDHWGVHEDPTIKHMQSLKAAVL